MKQEHAFGNKGWIWKDDSSREPNFLLFVHGYTGDADATWGRFPRLLVGTEDVQQGFEVASFEYETSLVWNPGRKVENIARLLESALAAEVQEAKHIFIVTHSLGGVVGRRFLVNTYQNPKRRWLFEKVRQLHFICVPQKGSRIWVGPFHHVLRLFNPLAEELLANSPVLLNILRDWGYIVNACAKCKASIPDRFNYVGHEDWLVPFRRAIPDFAEQEEIDTLEGGHTEIPKPTGSQSTIFRLVRDRILKQAERPARCLPVRSLHVGETPEIAATVVTGALHQLPPPPGDFTGRRKELDQLVEAVKHGGVTISGVRGMGGVGKTVLAQKIAAELAHDYPDAQIFLDLKGVDTTGKGAKPLKPAEAIAHVIRSFEPEARLPDDFESIQAIYRSVLHGKRALLLFDNAADADQVKPLIPPAKCLMLVTSRHRFLIPGLKPVDLDQLPRVDAEKMLLAIEPRIDSAASQLAQLCGDLPLALRSAGSFLAENQDWSVGSYVEKLKDNRTRLTLLKQGSDLDVDASLLVSYESLPEEQQQRFRILCVFPDTFFSSAASAIWDLKAEEAQRLLSHLVRISFLEFNSKTGRYRLHDLVKVFAEGRTSSSEIETANLRHSDHFKGILALADALYLEGKVLEGLNIFDLERRNIVQGQSWASLNRHKLKSALQLCEGYPDAGVYVLDLRVNPREKIKWLETAVAASSTLGNKEGEGNALGNLGSAYAAIGETRKAIECFEKHLVIAREVGNRKGEGGALVNLGISYKRLGEPRKAIEFYEKALAIDREIGDRRGEGSALGNLGVAYNRLGETRKAIEFYEKALAIDREIGDRRGEGSALGNLGNAYAALGETRKAIEFYEKALVIDREIGDRGGEAVDLFNASREIHKIGDTQKAIEWAKGALRIFTEIESPNAEKTRRQLREWGATDV